MVSLLIIALLSAGLALALAARGAILPRIRAEESLGQIEAYGYNQAAAAEVAESTSVFPSFAARLGDMFRGSGAERREEDARKLLLSAGIWGVNPATFIGYRMLAAVATAMVCTWLVIGANSSTGLAVAVGAYAAVVGWVTPVTYLKARVRRRLERIEIELPELIDLLVVTLEAGLGFNAALQRSTDRVRGPLGEEIRLALREQNLGLSTEQALQNMLERCDAPAVRAFVRGVSQGETLGISVGQIMRALAGDLRTRRRQIIEEKAQKAPIKMLFPLAFLILPAIFVVVLYPGLYAILETLNGG